MSEVIEEPKTKYKWTGSATYQKNGVTLNQYYSCWTDSKEEQFEYVDEVLSKIPSAKSFPDDDAGGRAEVKTVDEDPGFCKVHSAKMKFHENEKGSWYSHAKKEGEEWIYCSGKGWKEKKS